MINLRNIKTKDLINELLIREGVRSMNIEKGETVKSVVFLTEKQNDEDGTSNSNKRKVRRYMLIS